MMKTSTKPQSPITKNTTATIDSIIESLEKAVTDLHSKADALGQIVNHIEKNVFLTRHEWQSNKSAVRLRRLIRWAKKLVDRIIPQTFKSDEIVNASGALKQS